MRPQSLSTDPRECRFADVSDDACGGRLRDANASDSASEIVARRKRRPEDRLSARNTDMTGTESLKVNVDAPIRRNLIPARPPNPPGVRKPEARSSSEPILMAAPRLPYPSTRRVSRRGIC